MRLNFVSTFSTFSANIRSAFQKDHHPSSELTVSSLLLLTIAATALLAFVNVGLQRWGWSVPSICFLPLLVLHIGLVVWLLFQLLANAHGRHGPVRGAASAMALLLYGLIALRLVSSGFVEDDEIYSWNYWAIRIYNGQGPDFGFTIAPYPQLFSYWLGGMYKAIDGVVWQALPRGLLASTSLVIGVSLAQCWSGRGVWRALVAASLIFIVLATAIPWLTKGLADPLMTACVVASCAMLFRFKQDPQRLHLLYLALASGLMAGLAKQPGLLWSSFAAPLLALHIVHGAGLAAQQIRYSRMAIALAWFASLVWPLGIAPDFVNNEGVVNASMQGLTVWQTLVGSVSEYLLTRPHILGLLVVVVLITQSKLFRLLGLGYVIPALLAWLIFGAYSLRLGIHVVAMMALICCWAYGTERNAQDHTPHREVQPYQLAVSIAALLVVWSASLVWVAKRTEAHLDDSALTSLNVQWGAQNLDTARRLLDPHSRVWVSTIYALGPSYGRAKQVMVYSDIPHVNSLETLRDWLMQQPVDYLVTSDVLGEPSYVEWVRRIHQDCPQALTELLAPPNQKGFRLFSLDASAFVRECRM